MDAARGLPSFSEMFNAFKTKRTLADSLSDGMNTFNESKAATTKQNKEVADTQEAQSHANYYNYQAAGGGDKKTNLAAMDDKARAALQPYADKDGNVSETTAKMYIATTAQGQAANKAQDELAVKQAQLAEQAKHNDEIAKRDAELSALRASLGAGQQSLNAAQTVANVTSKEEPPSFMEKYVGSPIKHAITGTDTAGVIAERQKQAALQKLSETGGMQQPQHAPAKAQPQVAPSTEQLMAPPPAPAPVKRSVRHPGKPVAIYTQEDYDGLQPGASYIDSTGKVKVKGK